MFSVLLVSHLAVLRKPSKRGVVVIVLDFTLFYFFVHLFINNLHDTNDIII